jgi:hypothetical protein
VALDVQAHPVHGRDVREQRDSRSPGREAVASSADARRRWDHPGRFAYQDARHLHQVRGAQAGKRALHGSGPAPEQLCKLVGTRTVLLRQPGQQLQV